MEPAAADGVLHPRAASRHVWRKLLLGRAHRDPGNALHGATAPCRACMGGDTTCVSRGARDAHGGGWNGVAIPDPQRRAGTRPSIPAIRTLAGLIQADDGLSAAG